MVKSAFRYIHAIQVYVYMDYKNEQYINYALKTDKSKIVTDKIFLSPTNRDKFSTKSKKTIRAFSNFPVACQLPSYLTSSPPHRPFLLLTLDTNALVLSAT